MPINVRSLRRECDAAQRDGTPELFWDNLQEGLAAGHLDITDFRIRDLFEQFVPNGAEAVRLMDPRELGNGFNLMEAGDAIDTSAFANITGQVVYSTVLATFNDPVFLGGQLTATRSTQFDGERIPGVGRLGDAAETIMEAEEYPTVGVTEEWIETPRTTKRGFIVPITKEIVFFDRTGLVAQRAQEVATWLAVNKEKRILDTVLGIDTSYSRNGTSGIATYGNSAGSHDWDNLSASTALEDWTDVEAAELLFDAITDPNTGEPVSVVPNQLIVPTALKHTARRILSATETREVTNTDTTTISGNTLDSYAVFTNQYVKNRTSSASTWFIGDFKRAFAYMENWPISVTQAPSNSEAEFTKDIVSRFKVSERGTPAVIEPRYVVKCTA